MQVVKNGRIVMQPGSLVGLEEFSRSEQDQDDLMISSSLFEQVESHLEEINFQCKILISRESSARIQFRLPPSQALRKVDATLDDVIVLARQAEVGVMGTTCEQDGQKMARLLQRKKGECNAECPLSTPFSIWLRKLRSKSTTSARGIRRQ